VTSLAAARPQHGRRRRRGCSGSGHRASASRQADRTATSPRWPVCSRQWASCGEGRVRWAPGLHLAARLSAFRATSSRRLTRFLPAFHQLEQISSRIALLRCSDSISDCKLASSRAVGDLARVQPGPVLSILVRTCSTCARPGLLPGKSLSSVSVWTMESSDRSLLPQGGQFRRLQAALLRRCQADKLGVQSANFEQAELILRDAFTKTNVKSNWRPPGPRRARIRVQDPVQGWVGTSR